MCQQNGIFLFPIPFLLLYQFFIRIRSAVLHLSFGSPAPFVPRKFPHRWPISYEFGMQLRMTLVCNLVRLWYAISYDFGDQSRTSLVYNFVRLWLMEVLLSPNVSCAFRRRSLQYPLITWRLWEFVPLQSLPFPCRLVCCPPQVVSLRVGVAWRVRQFCCVGFPFSFFFFRARYI